MLSSRYVYEGEDRQVPSRGNRISAREVPEVFPKEEPALRYDPNVRVSMQNEAVGSNSAFKRNDAVYPMPDTELSSVERNDAVYTMPNCTR
jgi:hypothetical protein